MSRSSIHGFLHALRSAQATLCLSAVAVLTISLAPSDAMSQPTGYLTADWCKVTLPAEGNWKSAIGYATAQEPSAALRMATDDARRRLLETAGASLGKRDREELQRNIDTTWHDRKVEKFEGGYRACVVAFVRDTGMSIDQATDTFKASLRLTLEEFIAQLPPSKNGLRLSLKAPLLPNGHSAEEPGFIVHEQVKAVLGQLRSENAADVRLVEGPNSKWTTQLAGTIAAEGRHCILNLRYYLKDGDARPLPGIRFHPIILGLDECSERKSDAGDDALGLREGMRTGKDGLIVRLDAPLDGGMLCEGQPFSWKVEVSRPAYVRIYSVADDGRAMLGWSSTKPVQRWEPEKTQAAIAIKIAPDINYRLVAVATPAEDGPDAFGNSLPAPGCITAKGSGIKAADFPGNAAVSALSFGVNPLGHNRCRTTPAQESTVQKLKNAIEQMRICK